MTGEQAVVGLSKSPELRSPHPRSGSPQSPSLSGAEQHPDLQTLAQQASEVVDQPNGFLHHQQDGTSLDLKGVPISIPISSRRSHVKSYSLESHDPVAAGLPELSNSKLAHLEDVPTALDIDHFPDLIEEPLQDEHAPGWPLSHISDGLHQNSQQYNSESVEESSEPPIQAFAKLEFEDGEFFMTTYAIELGRDIQAARLAEEREREAGDGSESRSMKQSGSKNGSVRTDRMRKWNSHSMAESNRSEPKEVIADHYKSQSGKKPLRKKAKSPSSSLSRKSSMQFSRPKTDYNALAVPSLMDVSYGSSAMDAERTMPSPDVVPLIPIHPPLLPENASTGHKSISRKHIRIGFNFQKHLFEIEIIGRNGGFVDDEWYARGDIISLVNGSVIQIGGVGIRFVLPDVPQGETGAETSMGSDPLSGGMTSFDMDDGLEEESGKEDEDDENEEEDEEDEEDEETVNVKREKGEEPEILRTRARGKKKTEAPPPVPTKRKGPGRPPKNGIISKRGLALLAKQTREEAKAKAEGKAVIPGGDAKRKIGKDIKDTKGPKCEEVSVQPNGKRKYTKRKRAGGTEDPQAVRASTEHTDSVTPDQGLATALPPKPVKEKKPAKPPRSPSPVFDESTLTEEQLAKPQSSYVILIHEALSNSKNGRMSLPQIYHAIERRYPYYKVRVTTQGWQSSVRHNLSQHAAFAKIERDGKGWMWGLVPEVSIEKEKKRRVTPPPAPQQQYYPQHPMSQHPYPYSGIPPQNGHIPPGHYGMPHGMPPGRMPYPPAPSLPGFPLPLANAQSESNYRSPYQSTPPPTVPQSTPHQPHHASTNGANGMNGYYPTPLSQALGQSSDNNRSVAGSQITPPSQPPVVSTPSTNGNLNQDVNQAVSKFKTALIHNMEDKVRGEMLVTSAINRVLGIQAKSSLPDEEEDPNERTIMNKFSSMLGDLNKTTVDTKQQVSHPVPPRASNGGAPETSSQSQISTTVAAEQAAKIALADDRTASPATSPVAAGQAPEMNGAETS